MIQRSNAIAVATGSRAADALPSKVDRKNLARRNLLNSTKSSPILQDTLHSIGDSLCPREG